MSNIDIEDQFRKSLLNFYRSQRGGGKFPVFQGAEYQYGNGIGDIFKSIGRFLLPLLAPIANTFIQSTVSSLSEGKSLKESAREAIKPTLKEAGFRTADQIVSKFGGQSGSGRHRRRGKKHKAKKSRSRSRSRQRKATKRAHSTVYKGVKRRRLSTPTSSKSVRFLPQNF